MSRVEMCLLAMPETEAIFFMFLLMKTFSDYFFSSWCPQMLALLIRRIDIAFLWWSIRSKRHQWSSKFYIKIFSWINFHFISYCSNAVGLTLTAASHQALNSHSDSNNHRVQCARKWSNWVSSFFVLILFIHNKSCYRQRSENICISWKCEPRLNTSISLQSWRDSTNLISRALTPRWCMWKIINNDTRLIIIHSPECLACSHCWSITCIIYLAICGSLRGTVNWPIRWPLHSQKLQLQIKVIEKFPVENF